MVNTCKNCCSSRMVLVWTTLAALLFGGSLLLAFWGVPLLINWQIHTQTRLEKGTDQWERFEELPFQINYSIRFFIVTNTDEVKNNRSKPILEESEPYTYKLSIKKTNIKFDDVDEDSVTYKRSFHFEFDDSGKTSEDDIVTIVNPILMATLQLVNSAEKLALAGCLDLLLGPAGLDDIFITASVKKLLFDGINFAFSNETNLGVACEIVRKKMKELVTGIRIIEQMAESDVEYLRTAMFNYKTENYLKDSPDGIYTIDRGIKNMTGLGEILRWNGQTILTTYGNTRSTNNATCQTVRGTDSTIFSPLLESGHDLTIFNTDLCRTVPLEYVSSNETYRGIPAFRYETSKYLFRPATIFPGNDCYCMKLTKDVQGKDSCFLDGTFDVQPCLGAPAIVSQPHFLNADKKYLDAVEGLKPNGPKHSIYLLLEPNTGTPLEGMKRIQINTVLRKEPLISFITPDTMYEGVIPFLWLEEGFSLPQKYVNILNNQYFKKVRIATGVKYGLIATFASIFGGCLFIVWRKEYLKNKKH